MREEPSGLRFALTSFLGLALGLVSVGWAYGSWGETPALVIGFVALLLAWGALRFARPSYRVRVAPVSEALPTPESAPPPTPVTSPPPAPLTLSPYLELALIPGGNFVMGSSNDDRMALAEEKPPRRVDLPAFHLARTPVTRATYRKVMGAQAAPSGWRADEGDGELPETNVSWNEAVAFCNRLSELEGLEACYSVGEKSVELRAGANGYRLPSESEWEYACRAGTSTRYWSGDDEKDLERVGWYSANSDTEAHAVGKKPASPFGLFDMHGNVWEWCSDTWHGNYEGAPGDGSAWIDDRSVKRVLRGGSFASVARFARSAYRDWWVLVVRNSNVGFRPARSVFTPKPLHDLTPSAGSRRG